MLANHCTDDSVTVARKFAFEHLKFGLHIAHVDLPSADANNGHVRRLLINAAYERSASAQVVHVVQGVQRMAGTATVIVTNTEADTAVDSAL